MRSQKSEVRSHRAIAHKCLWASSLLFCFTFVGSLFASLPVPAPATAYRDPCTEWGEWDYGMGYGTLFLEIDHSGRASQVWDEHIFDQDGVLIAKVTVTQPQSGIPTFTVKEQLQPGAMTTTTLNPTWSVDTHYMDFFEYAQPSDHIVDEEIIVTAGSPVMMAIQWGHASATYQVRIVDPDDGHTRLGELPYTHKVAQRLAYYSIH